MKLADLELKHYGGPKISETLLIAKYAPVSTPHRDLDITHFFSVTSSMDSIIVKLICVTSKNQKIRCIMCFIKIALGKVYHVISRNHAAKHITFQIQPN